MKKTKSSYQEDLLQLSSTFSKMLKQRFGKGPETCFVTFYSNRLTVYIRNFITPAEEVLVESKQVNLAYNFRNAVMEKVFEDFISEATSLLDFTVDSCCYDWDYETNTGIALLENTTLKEESEFNQLKGKIFNQVMFVSSEVHKIPKRLEYIKLNHNIVAIECKGFMLQIEKVLYQKGHLDILQERSREIKESYLEYKDVFGNIFGREVEGLFMSWDYQQDRCYIFFYLQ